MALMPCPECKKKISETCESCPKCGYVLTDGDVEQFHKTKKNAEIAGGVGCVVIIVIIILVSTFGSDSGGGSGKGGGSSSSDPIAAYVMCQEFVSDRLKAPATADYPTYDSSFVTSLGQGRYRIEAYVDAQNGLGANVRTHFVCVIRDAGGDAWRLESFSTK